MNRPILSLEGVAVADGENFRLSPLSLEIFPGDRLGIEGPSGSGKTTLLRLLNRLHNPTQGRITYQGRPLEQYPVMQLRRDMMLVPQEARLLEMTVEQALRYPLTLANPLLSPKIVENRLAEAWERWQIPPEWGDRTELQLSVGQRHYLSIVRGTLVNPTVLLLDEPTAALDPALAQQTLTILETLNRDTGMTVIMVNHHPQQLRQFAPRIVALSPPQAQDF